LDLEKFCRKHRRKEKDKFERLRNQLLEISREDDEKKLQILERHERDKLTIEDTKVIIYLKLESHVEGD
jgi:hypothetical protein